MTSKSFRSVLTLVSFGLVGVFILSACHKPLRDRPKSRRGSRGAVIGQKDKVGPRCDPGQAALAALKAGGPVEHARMAKFPPAEFNESLVRHVVFVFQRAADSQRFASVFVETGECSVISSFEKPLGTNEPETDRPCKEAAVFTASAGDPANELIYRRPSANKLSPYEISWGRKFHEFFLVRKPAVREGTKDTTGETVALQLLNSENCQLQAAVTKPLKPVVSAGESRPPKRGRGEKAAP